MSVNEVFGANLRVLSLARGSLAKAGNDLGISRVQFQRYLKAESFPKPNELQRICIYFGVDARILTERLSPELLGNMGTAGQYLATLSKRQNEWLAAIDLVVPDHDYLAGPHVLVDGLYAVWRWSLSRPGEVARVLLQVSTHGGLKVMRGYESKSLFHGRMPSGPEREYRGICLAMRWGYSVLFFAREPSHVISHVYITPAMMISAQHVYQGFCTLARDEMPGARRVSRLVMEKVEGSWSQLLREARMAEFYAPADVAPHIMSQIAAPLV